MKKNKFYTQLIIFLASGAYTGFSPIASGTVGSLVGIAIYFLLPAHNPSLYLLITLLFFLAGSWISNEAEIIFGQKDSGRIVIDEIAGFFVAVFALPSEWPWLLAGFLMFRIADIIKPPPARNCEKISGGIGVMADDIIAGLYTNLFLQLFYYLSR